MSKVAIAGRSQSKFSVSTSAATAGPLNGGTYDIWCDVDVFVSVAQTAALADDVTGDTGYIIHAGNVVPVDVPHGWFIGAIAGGSGTLRFHQTGT